MTIPCFEYLWKKLASNMYLEILAALMYWNLKKYYFLLLEYLGRQSVNLCRMCRMQNPGSGYVMCPRLSPVFLGVLQSNSSKLLSKILCSTSTPESGTNDNLYSVVLFLICFYTPQSMGPKYIVFVLSPSVNVLGRSFDDSLCITNTIHEQIELLDEGIKGLSKLSS